jgi:hypothetical protein
MHKTTKTPEEENKPTNKQTPTKKKTQTSCLLA